MPWLESDELRAVRGRSVLFTKYVFWALSFAFVLLTGNAYFALVQHWLALLETTRQVLGIPVRVELVLPSQRAVGDRKSTRLNSSHSSPSRMPSSA